MSSKVFDVTRPGKSAPSSTSKPVIISNRPVLKDPMMVDEDNIADKAAETVNEPMLVTSKIKVEPIHDHVGPEDEADDSEDTKKTSKKETSTDKEDKKDALAIDEIGPIKLVDADAKPDKKHEDKKDEKQDTEDTADNADEKAEPEPDHRSTTQPTDQTSQAAQEKINEIANRKAVERAAEIQKLAESHKYFLPINQVEKRRNKHAAWAGVVLVLLLAVVWADVALDAGLVTVPGVKPPTHFFK